MSSDQNEHSNLLPPREEIPVESNMRMNPLQSVSNLSFGGTRKKLHALPQFSGNVEEWPMFEASFHESNVAFQYTDLENNFRLI